MDGSHFKIFLTQHSHGKEELFTSQLVYFSIRALRANGFVSDASVYLCVRVRIYMRLGLGPCACLYSMSDPLGPVPLKQVYIYIPLHKHCVNNIFSFDDLFTIFHKKD